MGLEGRRIGFIDLSRARGYFFSEPPNLLDTPLTFDQIQRRSHAMHGPDGSLVRIRQHNGKTLINTLASADNGYGKFAFKWDSYAAIGIDVMSGRTNQAATHCLTLEESRDTQTGFLPAKFPMPGMSFEEAPPESNYNMREGRTSYSQPPLTSWAAMKVFDGFIKEGRELDAKNFLKEMYGTAEPGNFTGMKGECAYFINQRQNSPFDPRIFIIDGNETGRDYDRALNGPNKYPIPGRRWLSHRLNDGIVWIMTQRHRKKKAKLGFDQAAEDAGLEKDLRRSDWLPHEVRKKYAVNDVMFNAMFVMNLRYTAKAGLILAELFPKEAKGYLQDAQMFEDLAEKLESAILKTMWDPKKKFFFNHDVRRNKRIKEKSITGLFPLLLRNISNEQLTALLDKLEDPKWFGTPYPIPTHPVCSRRFDPKNKRREGPNWQGRVWGITNHFEVEEGLILHTERLLGSRLLVGQELGRRCLRNAANVAEKSHMLHALNPTSREHFDPYTGQGGGVDEFGWSNLMLYFQKYEESAKKYNLEEELNLQET